LDKQMLSLVPLQQTPPGMHTLTLASNWSMSEKMNTDCDNLKSLCTGYCTFRVCCPKWLTL
jgi:hypothetical protein